MNNKIGIVPIGLNEYTVTQFALIVNHRIMP